MPLKANYKIGSLVIQIEGETVKELFESCELLCQLPQACSCGSQDISPAYARAQDKYEYYFLKCRSCGNEFKLGQRKSDKGLFPKTADGWQPPFKGSRSGNNEPEEGGDEW